MSSRTALVVQMLILAFLVFSFGREFARDYSIQQEITDLEAERAALESENAEIAAFMNSVQTETYIEREARLKLGLAKPGEKVVVLPSPETNKEAVFSDGSISDFSAQESLLDLSSIANPKKWWYYFFDVNKYEMIKYYGNNPVR